MSQHGDFSAALSHDAHGSHKPTPPSALLTVTPAASQSSATAASYASTGTVLLSFPIAQGSLLQSSRVDNPKALLVVQDAIKKVIENQESLQDQMKRIMSNQRKVMSNQSRMEKRLEDMAARVLQLSEACNDWKGKTESEGSMDACNE